MSSSPGRGGVRIGTAGWSIPRASADAFAADGTHLQRYARVLDCAEINSSFHRAHRPETYARWAAETPADFRFAVKLPRTVTHDRRLRAARAPLQQFLGEVAGLGRKLAVLLVQLPPSLVCESRQAQRFFALLHELCEHAVVCEPRHRSWFTPAAQALLVRARVGRVAADPAPVPEAAQPGGWLGAEGDGRGAVVYHRWHGAPRRYWSAYDAAWLQLRAQQLQQWPTEAQRWCIFDNTASGAATADALALRAALARRGNTLSHG
jgi:uncharacterized protein YecE (DUF72 family)